MKSIFINRASPDKVNFYLKLYLVSLQVFTKDFGLQVFGISYRSLCPLLRRPSALRTFVSGWRSINSDLSNRCLVTERKTPLRRTSKYTNFEGFSIALVIALPNLPLRSLPLRSLPLRSLPLRSLPLLHRHIHILCD